MPKSMTLSVAAGLALLVAAGADLATAGQYHSLAEAQAAAIEQQKPLLIDFHTEW